MPLNTLERKWQIANIPYMLQEKRYQELDEIYNRALQESFTSRQAEKRYFLSRTQMCNYFYDMNTLVDAGTEGLRLIKTGSKQDLILHMPGLPKHNTGITVHGYIAVMAGQMIPHMQCGFVLVHVMNKWSSLHLKQLIVTHDNGWLHYLPAPTQKYLVSQRLAAHLNGDSVAGIPLMIALKIITAAPRKKWKR